MAFYFAYGDRMNAEKMTGSIPGARLVGPGRLDGYRLVFNVNSRAWGGGAANAVPDARSSVWGVGRFETKPWPHVEQRCTCQTWPCPVLDVYSRATAPHAGHSTGGVGARVGVPCPGLVHLC